jgi:nicotinamide-nucleotide amidase
MFSEAILNLAETALQSARDNHAMITTAESCTGGLVSAALTAVAGSSDVFDCGFSTYSYKAKSSLLGVPQSILVEHGAVSEQVAALMAEGALAHSTADVSVALTGIAGPSGGLPGKPIGTVCFACARIGAKTRTLTHQFGDLGRPVVRIKSVEVALGMLAEAFI